MGENDDENKNKVTSSSGGEPSQNDKSQIENKTHQQTQPQEQTMSKNQLKKLAKKQKWEAIKHEKRSELYRKINEVDSSWGDMMSLSFQNRN